MTSAVLVMTEATSEPTGMVQTQAPSVTDLTRIVPELRNPRILEEADLPEQWRSSIREFSLGLVVAGDFNRDGVPKVALVGKYENRGNPDDQIFVAILSRTAAGWKKEFMMRPGARYAAITTSKDFTVTTDSIVVWLTYAPSDDYAIIYWDGTRYRTESGFDIIHNEIRRRRGR